MLDEVLAVIIPDGFNNKVDNGEIDFLFLSKNKEIKRARDEEELQNLYDNISNIKFEHKEGEDYHIYHIIDYLKKFLKDETKTLPLDKFNPDNQYVLYRILAHQGIIILTNSEYTSLLYIPKNLSLKQKESLLNLGSFIEKDKVFDAEIVESYKKGFNLDRMPYDEILSHLQIYPSDLKLNIK